MSAFYLPLNTKLTLRSRCIWDSQGQDLLDKLYKICTRKHLRIEDINFVLFTRQSGIFIVN